MPCCPGDVINKLLKRYVRMRAYIATKHIQDIYQEKRKNERKPTNDTSRAPLYVSSSKMQVISIYFRFSCRRRGCNRFFQIKQRTSNCSQLRVTFDPDTLLLSISIILALLPNDLTVGASQR